MSSCLHLVTSPDRLLWNLSLLWRHKEHLFVMLEYAFPVHKISHVRAGVTFSIFLYPYLIRKSSPISIKFVSKRFDMIIILLLFKFSLSQSKIYFFRVTECCCTFVYQTFLSAISIEWAICLNSTVTIKGVSVQSFCFRSLLLNGKYLLLV